MLRQVFIYKGTKRLFGEQFGKSLGDDAFADILDKMQKETFGKGKDATQFQSYDYYKYRVSNLFISDKNLLFVFVTDLTDPESSIKKQLQVLKNEFMNMFGSVLDKDLDASDLEIITPAVEMVHKELVPKISLVGFSGVGKTTITCLIRAQEIPVEHVPTITGDVGTIQIGKLSFALWDFAGQEQFSFLWNKFVKGSDAVLIITDSTVENVDKSRFFIELIKNEAPHAHVAIIGNKQDLPGAIPVSRIEQMLEGAHTYSMVAVDPANREKMMNIIADVLEISPEMSPLLKPLIERDKKMEQMEAAVKNSDFQTAYSLAQEISDLCLSLGDDNLSRDFHSKADMILETLKKMGQIPQPKKAPEEVRSAPTIGTPSVSPASAPTVQAPSIVTPPEISATAGNQSPQERKKQIEDTIMNLKINMANLDKFILDMEMQVIMGQVLEVDFNERKKKTLVMKDNIQKQIAQYEGLLKGL